MAEKLILTVTKLRKPIHDALRIEAAKQQRTISQQVRLHLEEIYGGQARIIKPRQAKNIKPGEKYYVAE